jgi:hypothetical protein
MKYSFKKLVNTLFSVIITLLILALVPANAESCTSIYQVTATQLNVRDQASTSGAITGTLDEGDQVCISQERGNWGRTDNGWISMKHLVLLDNINQDSTQTVNTTNSNTSGDSSGLMVVIIVIIILAAIFFALKTLFYHSLISFGMAVPDGRSKSGIRLTRLGKFLASISGLLLFLLFLVIVSQPK